MQLKKELEGGAKFTDAEAETLFNALDSGKGDGNIDIKELQIETYAYPGSIAYIAGHIKAIKPKFASVPDALVQNFIKSIIKPKTEITGTEFNSLNKLPMLVGNKDNFKSKLTTTFTY